MKHAPPFLTLILLLSACGKQEPVVRDPEGSTVRGMQPVVPKPADKPAEKPGENPSNNPGEKPGDVPPPPNNPSFSDEEVAVNAGVLRANEIRAENKLPELVLDEKLSAAAQKHAEDMAARDFFDHVNPEKETPFDRMKKAGATFNSAAENIAKGVPSAAEVFDGWMASPGHKTNLLNKAYGRHGLGFKAGYWVHVFAD